MCVRASKKQCFVVAVVVVAVVAVVAAVVVVAVVAVVAIVKEKNYQQTKIKQMYG